MTPLEDLGHVSSVAPVGEVVVNRLRRLDDDHLSVIYSRWADLVYPDARIVAVREDPQSNSFAIEYCPPPDFIFVPFVWSSDSPELMNTPVNGWKCEVLDAAMLAIHTEADAYYGYCPGAPRASTPLPTSSRSIKVSQQPHTLRLFVVRDRKIIWKWDALIQTGDNRD
jgi:hypothetical protein